MKNKKKIKKDKNQFAGWGGGGPERKKKKVRRFVLNFFLIFLFSFS